LRFHDLRSVATSAMVATGVDVKTAQRRLGHAKVTLTLQV
jgi:integrase